MLFFTSLFKKHKHHHELVPGGNISLVNTVTGSEQSDFKLWLHVVLTDWENWKELFSNMQIFILFVLQKRFAHLKTIRKICNLFFFFFYLRLWVKLYQTIGIYYLKEIYKSDRHIQGRVSYTLLSMQQVRRGLAPCLSPLFCTVSCSSQFISAVLCCKILSCSVVIFSLFLSLLHCLLFLKYQGGCETRRSMLLSV